MLAKYFGAVTGRLTRDAPFDEDALRQRIQADQKEIAASTAIAIEANGRMTRIIVRTPSGQIRRVFPVRRASVEYARDAARMLAADLGIFYVVRRNPK
jgi:hypothetical protein